MIEVEKEIKKLNAVKGNVRAIQKKMKHVHNAARAAGRFINGEQPNFKNWWINLSSVLKRK